MGGKGGEGGEEGRCVVVGRWEWEGREVGRCVEEGGSEVCPVLVKQGIQLDNELCCLQTISALRISIAMFATINSIHTVRVYIITLSPLLCHCSYSTITVTVTVTVTVCPADHHHSLDISEEGELCGDNGTV